MIIAKKAVRCRDCKYFIGGGEINHGCGLCTRFIYEGISSHTVSVDEKDFCSKGEYGDFMDMDKEAK